MINFIYCPQSGDRVFAEEYPEGPSPEVIPHPNGCRHVIGGAHLWWNTAVPLHYWRDQAKTLAEMLIARYGGIASDSR